MRNTTAAMPLTIIESTARSPLVWARESGQGQAEDGEEHDAHGGAEVAAVDRGGEDPRDQEHRPRAGMGRAAVEGTPQHRLGGEQGGGPQDEPGDDVVERRRGRREQEQGAGDPAGQGDRGEADQAPGLVTDLAAEAGGRGHVARPDPDRVGDVRREGGVAERRAGSGTRSGCPRRPRR